MAKRRRATLLPTSVLAWGLTAVGLTMLSSGLISTSAFGEARDTGSNSTTVDFVPLSPGAAPADSPVLTGDQVIAQTQPEEAAPDPIAADPIAQALVGNSIYQAPGVTPGRDTNSVVWDKIEAMRGELTAIQVDLTTHNALLQDQRETTRQAAGTYHGLVDAINARLRDGTTPGNPDLVTQWEQAQGENHSISETIAHFDSLVNRAAANVARAGVLMEDIEAAYELRGGYDDDHLQLDVLKGETLTTTLIIEQMLNEVSADVVRVQNYFTTERANLTTLQIAVDNGEYIGMSLSQNVYGEPTPPPPGGGASLVGQVAPLVVIRFDRPGVDYQQVLYTAVSEALTRKPNAGFDLVGIGSGAGTEGEVAMAIDASRRHAEGVLRTLITMGLPSDRMTLTSTSHPNVGVPEVHVYVR